MKIKIIAAALCLALLAGCADTSSSGQSLRQDGSSSAPVSSVQTSSSGEESVRQVRDYDKEALVRLLGDINNAEAGSAGSTIKAAMVAADFIEFSVENATDKNERVMLEDIQRWYSALTAEQRADIAVNWPLVYGTLNSIVEDPAGKAGLLADGGVETDFSAMDLTNAKLLADRVAKVIGAR